MFIKSKSMKNPRKWSVEIVSRAGGEFMNTLELKGIGEAVRFANGTWSTGYWAVDDKGNCYSVWQERSRNGEINTDK